MGKVSATSGMYIRSRMSFHLVLSVVYGLLTCVTKVNRSTVTSITLVIAELTYESTMHIIVYVNNLLMRFLSCNYY